MPTYRPYSEDNIQVFWDTQRMINTEPELHRAVRASIDSAVVYGHEDEIELRNHQRFDNPAEVVLSRKRSYQAAMDSITVGKTAVLNFASARTPGGGVVKGSGAQEESLCRCSTLHPCLVFDEANDRYYSWNRKHMPSMGSDGIIYSKDIVIIKTDTSKPERLPRNKWTKVDVITCAAPDFRYQLYDEDEFIPAIRRRIDRILEIAARNEVDNLILGAFGCGAFANPPDAVARIFKEELKFYMNAFKRIEFAIMGFSDDPNYQEFKKVFG